MSLDYLLEAPFVKASYESKIRQGSDRCPAIGSR